MDAAAAVTDHAAVAVCFSAAAVAIASPAAAAVNHHNVAAISAAILRRVNVAPYSTYCRICCVSCTCVCCLSFRKLHFFISLGFIGFFLLNILALISPSPTHCPTHMRRLNFLLCALGWQGGWGGGPFGVLVACCQNNNATRPSRSKNNLKHTLTCTHAHTRTRKAHASYHHILFCALPTEATPKPQPPFSYSPLPFESTPLSLRVGRPASS